MAKKKNIRGTDEFSGIDKFSNYFISFLNSFSSDLTIFLSHCRSFSKASTKLMNLQALHFHLKAKIKQKKNIKTISQQF